jgi:hypothetical protein
MKTFFASLTVAVFAMWGGLTEASAFTDWMSGEEPEFWRGRAVLVGRISDVESTAVVWEADVQVEGVVSTDVFVPVRLHLVNIRALPNSALFFHPAEGTRCVMVLEPNGDHWRIPPFQTPLFGTDYAAKTLEGENAEELRLLLDRLAKIRRRSSAGGKGLPDQSAVVSGLDGE